MYPAKPQNCKQRDHKKRSSPTTKVGLDPFFLVNGFEFFTMVRIITLVMNL